MFNSNEGFSVISLFLTGVLVLLLPVSFAAAAARGSPRDGAVVFTKGAILPAVEEVVVVVVVVSVVAVVVVLWLIGILAPFFGDEPGDPVRRIWSFFFSKLAMKDCTPDMFACLLACLH